MASGDKAFTTPPGRFAATLPIEGRVGANAASFGQSIGPGAGEGAAERLAASRRKTAAAKAALKRAKQLRQRLTGPEAKLWSHLKRIQTVDTHFRKQAPIGPYVVDFACLRARVVIEVDGDQHGWHRGQQRDRSRDRFLKAQGFTVLRFWNHEVLQEMESVLDTIYDAVHGGAGAVPGSAARCAADAGRAPSSPSMGEVVRLAGPEGVISSRNPAVDRSRAVPVAGGKP